MAGGMGASARWSSGAKARMHVYVHEIAAGVNVAVMAVEVGVQSWRWLMGMLIRLLVVRQVMCRHRTWWWQR
jgi:hypothetical protein